MYIRFGTVDGFIFTENGLDTHNITNPSLGDVYRFDEKNLLIIDRTLRDNFTELRPSVIINLIQSIKSNHTTVYLPKMKNTILKEEAIQRKFKNALKSVYFI